MEDSYMKKTEGAEASSGKEKLITLENVSKHFHVGPRQTLVARQQCFFRHL